jgi:hypothetical protein
MVAGDPDGRRGPDAGQDERPRRGDRGLQQQVAEIEAAPLGAADPTSSPPSSPGVTP